MKKNLAHKIIKHAERGMTLVEIMVVVVIIGLVTSVVGVAVFNSLTKAQAVTARTQIQQISNALDMYKLSYRQYPSTAEGLQMLVSPKDGAGSVMPTVPEDPWGKQYVYIYPGQNNARGFDLYSYGPDGVAGGGDDVTNWESAGGGK
ncbi:MAG: type II secretion system major pseudopilin GspG [Clostridia bacterium]|nr:type II secretion system major pseudopilin GspG [Deltaproteobacteria bacterium]